MSLSLGQQGGETGDTEEEGEGQKLLWRLATLVGGEGGMRRRVRREEGVGRGGKLRLTLNEKKVPKVKSHDHHGRKKGFWWLVKSAAGGGGWNATVVPGTEGGEGLCEENTHWQTLKGFCRLLAWVGRVLGGGRVWQGQWLGEKGQGEVSSHQVLNIHIFKGYRFFREPKCQSENSIVYKHTQTRWLAEGRSDKDSL